MKKILVIAAVAMVSAAMFTSCNKQGNGDTPTIQKRVAEFANVGDGWEDRWVYTYDANGKIASVVRNNGEKSWEFTFNGNKASAVYSEGGEEVGTLSFDLNDKGFCTSFTDEWGDVRYYTYNADGRITQIKKGEDVKSNLVITDGCIEKWSKFEDGVEQWKIHGYTTTKNLGDIHNIVSEATDPSRWLYETGLFGHGTAYLCEYNQWEKYQDDPTTRSELTYEFDADGFVVAENKTYQDWPERYEYVWEVLK